MTEREYSEGDVPGMIAVWNEVVDEGNAFPQEERLGFKQPGTIPGGFRLDNGEYADVCPYFIEL